MAIRTILARGVLAAAAATLLAACAGPSPTAAPSTGLALRAAQSTPAACMAALLSGVLVQEPQSGVGIRDDNGEVWQVIWPFGYTARVDADRFAILDATGNVLAHVGDRVGVGGGEVGAGVWLGCDGIVPPA